MENPYKAVNSAAKLHESSHYPAIEVAGVMVFVYVDERGTLRISAHFDNADVAVWPDCEVAVPVRVDGVDREHVY